MMPMAGAAGANASQVETSGAAMAFTYVPVPVYNMATVAQTAAPAGGPNISNILSPGTMQPQGTSTPSQPHQAHQPSGGSPGSQPSSLEAQQLAYQQAFLQNAVAQNMQIQQQLMMQNQALAQLLQQTPQTAAGITNTTAAAAATANSSISTIMGTPSLPSMIPMAQYQQMQMQQQQLTEQTLLMAADGARKISAGDVLEGRKSQQAAMEAGKQRSLSTPNTPRQDGLMVQPVQDAAGNLMDPYTRYLQLLLITTIKGSVDLSLVTSRYLKGLNCTIFWKRYQLRQFYR